ncbi:penicillin-binding protein [Luteolibacter ambystomatis]|uniref:peptidoglycan glycosyltransferase n=1 Tax=Luteolibacter ambystomatis TaxID=2824561 RepID=A0A975G666_9BACT|nr:transglycosylase domain-containing protein [Luteolibacter ambystomatis]QUE49550.1 penicillin-binding protein [Luteolibacter ambystomatis]
MSTWRPITTPSRFLRWVPAWLHTPLKWVLKLGVLATVIVCGIAFFYFCLAMKFDLDEVNRLPAANIVYDRNDKEMDASTGNNRRLITRADLPEFLVKGLQAREDARFFDHSGVDVRGLMRATIRNLKDRDFTQGASTLTMQLARNTFDIRAKSLHRKFLEIALTLRIEGRYDKNQILTGYLNRIYFGAGCHGIEEAARTYFGRPVRELNEGECAMIVGIIRGPHIFSPFRNLPAAEAQRNEVLDRMIAMKFITEADKERIISTPVRLVKDDDREVQRSYAMQQLRRELDTILDESDIRLGGLQIRTNLDSAWQTRLETELARAVESLENEKTWQKPTHAAHKDGEPVDYLQYAAITIEYKSGAILAYIGGRDFKDSRYDFTRVRRDLGSAFEPFVAAAAAERKKLVLPGKPVQTGRQVGPAEVQRIAKRCGISGPFLDTEDLFRGSVSATPMEMAVGLSTLGNKGRRPRAFFIREIRNAAGEVLYTGHPQESPALSASAATEAKSVLKPRSGTLCFTGATGSEREAWTLRLGPKGATVIWIGFDKPSVIAPEARLKALLDEFVDRLGNE